MILEIQNFVLTKFEDIQLLWNSTKFGTVLYHVWNCKLPHFLSKPSCPTRYDYRDTRRHLIYINLHEMHIWINTFTIAKISPKIVFGSRHKHSFFILVCLLKHTLTYPYFDMTKHSANFNHTSIRVCVCCMVVDFIILQPYFHMCMCMPHGCCMKKLWTQMLSWMHAMQ